MNKKKNQTFNRSDIEKTLSLEFQDLSKSQISLAVDSILESIVDAVLTMISRPDKMEKMGKKGRLISKDYTLENWQNRIKTLLNDSVFKN